MLAPRHCEAEKSLWSSKYDISVDTSNGPRMSNIQGHEVAHPDWQHPYSFLTPGESGVFSQSFELASGSNRCHEDTAQQPRQISSDNDVTGGPHRTVLESPVSPMTKARDMTPSGVTGIHRPENDHPAQEAVPLTDDNAIKTEDPETMGSSPSTNLASGTSISDSSPVAGQDGGQADRSPTVGKEEDDGFDDDEYVLDADGERREMTAAERIALKRKMKRFRLTHQQTRFLMSEFAKQPHPDAAHRERLSRQIPGLSPRQVQVWFQNRRAKMKRMDSGDREDMLKSRAMPDGFDNLRALHDQYGVVEHGMGQIQTPVTPSMEFGGHSYNEVLRPTMVETIRRNDGAEHLSPTGLSPAFNNVNFAHSPMGTPDMLSPMSAVSNERPYYSNMNSPIGPGPGPGPRTPNTFVRADGYDSGAQLHVPPRHHSHGARLQPLQIRETLSRSRSDTTIRSPLRTSMSWKGDTVDYSYQTDNTSPAPGNRQPPPYRPENVNHNGIGYDPGNYTPTTLPSPAHQAPYSTAPSPPENRLRLRAGSGHYPGNLDLRNPQYRAVSVGHGVPSTPHAPAMQHVAPATSYPTAPAYTTSFPSAPLTAPMEFGGHVADKLCDPPSPHRPQ